VNKRNKLLYTTFLIPIILTILSWTYFPNIAQTLTTAIFNISTPQQTANPLWQATINLFYTWYTIQAIGIATTWIIIALIARRKHTATKQAFPPMVSFIVPAYNQEANITRCINSLTKCTEKYSGNCEIIIIDDGSTDFTYETALTTAKTARAAHPRVCLRVLKVMTNLGKIEALRTGVNRALGSVIAVVDADSEWSAEALQKLIDELCCGRVAVTGFVHPNGVADEGNVWVALQRLEYSRGLAVGRCAQGLGDDVLVVSGAVGVFDASSLRGIVVEKGVRSVTEDLEVTLELHKRGGKVGYVGAARSCTVAPSGLGVLWRQRLRWFSGWLDNTLRVHRGLLSKGSWVSALLWYSFVFEFFGAFVDLAALAVFPFLWFFAPGAVVFGLNLLVFGAYGFLIGVVTQMVALKLAYGSYSCGLLLFYLPLYPVLRFVNVVARVRSVFDYFRGHNGKWH
jgi:cellulose synthase/poly-beta-1,6-N-acetylglucosamine synthase-like glycosyltransferase